jgi:aminopeptidase N
MFSEGMEHPLMIYEFFCLNSISANLKHIVYCTAISVGGQDEWDFAWQRYRKTNIGSEKDILLGALGCSRETWILSRY